MQIRTITYGLCIKENDFLIDGQLEKKFDDVIMLFTLMQAEFASIGYEAQTLRVSLNSLEDWLIPLMDNQSVTMEFAIDQLASQLTRTNITFCTVGACCSSMGIELLSRILIAYPILSGSVTFARVGDTHIAPDYEYCQRAAKLCLDLATFCGDLGNFRYCVSFNCSGGGPFFPVAFHESTSSGVSIGLENGDILTSCFTDVKFHERGRSNLIESMKQRYMPIQATAMSACEMLDVEYLGMDASLNPGLYPEGSIGSGLEHLIFPAGETTFGSMGTLAAVSTVTSAVKALAGEGLKLIGYNGLMLPVMEDLRLAELAAQPRPPFMLRDLLLFSSVCGVGLDTVPIPGNTSVDALAGLYMEVGAMAFRLNKALSCRVLPMKSRVAGDMTDVESPFLCNTRVLSING